MELGRLSGPMGRIAAVLLLSLCSAAQAQIHFGRGKALGIARPADWSSSAGPLAGAGGSNMTYHGGSVMAGEKHFYYIWYGDWSKDRETVDILTDLVSALGGSPYFATNAVYTDKEGRPISAEAKYTGAFEDHYSQGASFAPGAAGGGFWTDSYDDIYGQVRLRRVVANAIKKGGLPADPDGIYLVVPSKDVSHPSAFGTEFCAYHTYGAIGGVHLKYAFIGNVDDARDSCGYQAVSPNGNPVADAMASLIAHEINEAVTDPETSGWYLGDLSHENADLCAWQFGETQKDSNGAEYNVTLGARNYRLQQNWVNDDEGGQCRLQLPGSEPAQLADNSLDGVQ